MTGSDADALMAYQIAFDLYESATQQFLSRVLATIKKTAPSLPAPAAAAPTETEQKSAAEGEGSASAAESTETAGYVI